MSDVQDARPDLLMFTRLLRRAGVTVGTGQMLAFMEAAEALAPVDTVDLYWAGRTSLIDHRRDLATYDVVFRAWFLEQDPEVDLDDEEAGPGAAIELHTVRPTAPEVVPEPAADEDAPVVGAVAAEVELLRHRRFDEATDAELREMRALMARIPLSLPRRASRRTEPLRRGRHPDLRRTVRRAIQTDGELVRRAWRHRRRRTRPLVLVLDVSGSMAGYSRALLQFAFSARLTAEQVEVFCFGTRLTRVTGDLEDHDVDVALQRAAARVVDWDGGTLIGPSLARLNRHWGRRGTLRGAVVVICSDGLERGEPDVLRDEMARLSRLAHKVVWVNPLKGDDRYRPVQRGMRAALPHVDRFVTGHDLASLHDLANVLGALR